MDSYEKFLLLGSLSFFFGCLAASLVLLNINSKQPAPDNIPTSVLAYTVSPSPDRQAVDCYLKASYGNLLETRKLSLQATADMGGDRLEIYADDDNNFAAFVLGPDAAGDLEACEVANGVNWHQP